MSKMIEVFRALPNKGLMLSKPEEFLKYNYSVDGSINLEFSNELLQGRLGIVKLNNALLSGPITLIDQYWLDTGTWYLMICTTKDIYKYDFDNSRFDILTPLYQTGTITIAAETPTIVTGSGTSWASQLIAGGYIKINTGNVHTGATWYEIQSVDSDTQLTLKTSASASSNSAYVARKIFTGTATDFWKSVIFEDDNLGKIWIAINGVNKPVRWDTSGQVIPLATLPTGFTTAKFINVYKDRLFFFWCIVDGNNMPRTGYWSEVANCESWSNLDYIDFLDEDYWITNVTNFFDYQIIFRERDAIIGRYIGGDYTFAWEVNSKCGGVWGVNSVVTTQHYIYYWGPDNKFHRWNLLTEEDIFGDELLPFMKDLNLNTEQYIFGWEIEVKNQIRWFIPYGDIDYHNYVFVYDYEQHIANLWSIAKAQSLWCIGEYLNVEDLYADDPVYGELYADEVESFADTREFLEGAPIILYGGYDGYVRKADIGTNDDGETYTRRFRSIRDNFGLPNRYKRLHKQEFWLESQLAGNITISLKRDDNNSFDSSTKTISLINANRDIIKESLRWDREAQNFQTQIEATIHFAILGYINRLFSKRKTF